MEASSQQGIKYEHKHNAAQAAPANDHLIWQVMPTGHIHIVRMTEHNTFHIFNNNAPDAHPPTGLSENDGLNVQTPLPHPR